MRAFVIVVAAPIFNDDLSLVQRLEDFSVQKLITQAGVEALDVAIFPRAARFDVSRLRAHGCDPASDSLSDELRTIVRADERRDATQNELIRKSVDDIHRVEFALNPDRQAFPCELINQVQRSKRPPIIRAAMHEVIRPDMVRMLSPEPDARPIVEPQAAPFRLF